MSPDNLKYCRYSDPNNPSRCTAKGNMPGQKIISVHVGNGRYVNVVVCSPAVEYYTEEMAGGENGSGPLYQVQAEGCLDKQS